MKINKLEINGKERCRFTEPISVKNEKFLFEIRREGETIFLIDGEPKSVVWHDNGPSSVHFYSLLGTEMDDNTSNYLKQINNLTQGTISDAEIPKVFEAYQPLIKSGIYRIFYSPPHSYKVDNISSNRVLRPFSIIPPSEKNNARPSLYLDEGLFMFTQSMETIDSPQIKFYQENIFANKFPTIVTLGMQPKQESPEDVYSQFTEAYPQYIIDGHHKALAYELINAKNRKEENAYTVMVPGIFSIVRIHSPDEIYDKEKRRTDLSKICSNDEVNEILAFYENF